MGVSGDVGGGCGRMEGKGVAWLLSIAAGLSEEMYGKHQNYVEVIH